MNLVQLYSFTFFFVSLLLSNPSWKRKKPRIALTWMLLSPILRKLVSICFFIHLFVIQNLCEVWINLKIQNFVNIVTDMKVSYVGPRWRHECICGLQSIHQGENGACDDICLFFISIQLCKSLLCFIVPTFLSTLRLLWQCSTIRPSLCGGVSVTSWAFMRSCLWSSRIKAALFHLHLRKVL